MTGLTTREVVSFLSFFFFSCLHASRAEAGEVETTVCMERSFVMTQLNSTAYGHSAVSKKY